MAFNFRHHHNHRTATWHHPPPSGSMDFFADQALREDFHHRLPSFRSSPLFPMDRQFAIQREIEKQIIREEIIEAEIFRRRMLAEEVRRELMFERHMALQQELKPIHPSSMLSNETRPLERRLEGLEPMPFQRSSKPFILEIKPPPVVTEGETITMDKPILHLSGLKRKTDTPLEMASADWPLPTPVSSKKMCSLKSVWSCSLCQVSATSEGGLKDHLNGKKHKANELKLRQNNNENKQDPLEKEEVETLLETKTDCMPKKEEEDSDEGNNEVGEMKVEKQEEKNDDELKTRKNNKSNRLKHWCKICKVGTPALKLMRHHLMGKKHLKNVKLLGGRVPPTAIETNSSR